MPIFSVVIPTYNRRQLLEQSIESVARQTLDDYEIIVVDDGSDDDTRRFLATISDRVRVVHQQNLGPGAARNAGAALATGQYIAFLDSDDLWYRNTLSTIDEIVHSYLNPAIVQICPAKELDGSPGREAIGEFVVFDFVDVLTAAEHLSIMGSGATFVRRDVWNSSHGFICDRVVGEDIAFLMQIADCGPYVMIQSPKLFIYRQHTGNTTGPMKYWRDGVKALLREFRAGRLASGPSITPRISRWVAQDSAYRATEVLKRPQGWRSFPALYVDHFPLQVRSHNFGYLFKSPFRWLLSISGFWPRQRSL